MYEIFRLIRIRTIAFAALTMYAMRYLVIRPMLDINGLALQMTGWAFFLLVVAVCCLISGAYVINDYFDTKSDRISGIKKVVVGKSISRRVAISLHTVLNLFAVSIAFYLGFAVGVWKIGILFLLVSGILWFYSSTYKKYFFDGKFVGGYTGFFDSNQCYRLRNSVIEYGLCRTPHRNRNEFFIHVRLGIWIRLVYLFEYFDV